MSDQSPLLLDNQNANSLKPRITLLHYTAPPVIGGVEAVMAEHARLFVGADCPTAVVVGRGGSSGLPDNVVVRRISEIDSEYPENLVIAAALDHGEMPPTFFALRDRIAAGLADALADADIVMAHNVLTMHFNLPLVAALHDLLDRGVVRNLVAWCHDISRYVRPSSGAVQRSGYPWDLLRRYRPDLSYVAVSAQRQRLLAGVINCPPERIACIPNGVDHANLLGLSGVGRHLVEEFNLLEADLVLLMPIRITRAKNIEFALQVTAAIKAGGLRPRLVVTGPPDPHSPEIGAYFDELCALRHALNVEEEAVFAYEGTARFPRPFELSPSIVAELYRAADLVLLPSHREGFGMPVLEGGLADKPVFATAVPIVEEIGVDRMFLIQPDEPPESVAARIQDWTEGDASHRLRRRVRQVYTWPAIFTRSIEPLIKGLTSPRGRSA